MGSGFDGAGKRLLHRFDGELEGAESAGRVSDTAPGDGEGSAVIRTDTETGQTEGGVHRIVEVQQFEWDESLVMVGSNDAVVEIGGGIAINAVWNARTSDERSVSKRFLKNI